MCDYFRIKDSCRVQNYILESLCVVKTCW